MNALCGLLHAAAALGYRALLALAIPAAALGWYEPAVRAALHALYHDERAQKWLDGGGVI